MERSEFHYVDGRPVTFDRHSVQLMEPHVSGSGTLVRIGPADHLKEMHLREDYAAVKAEIEMPYMERLMREFDPADEQVPF